MSRETREGRDIAEQAARPAQIFLSARGLSVSPKTEPSGLRALETEIGGGNRELVLDIAAFSLCPVHQPANHRDAFPIRKGASTPI